MIDHLRAMHSVGLIRPSPFKGNGDVRLMVVRAAREGKHLGGLPWEGTGSGGIALFYREPGSCRSCPAHQPSATASARLALDSGLLTPYV